MSDSFQEPRHNSSGFVKLVGRIENYQAQRDRANFFFTYDARGAVGMTAVAAAAVGAGTYAAGVVASGSDMEEEADYVEFTIDGTPVKGWLWCSPFAEGDEVAVVGEWKNEFLQVAAVARPIDRVVALFPHCSRGRRRHIKNAIKWWLIVSPAMLLFTWLLIAVN
jgi:hypothetical protein